MKIHELFRRLTRPVCLLLVLLTLVGYAAPKAEAASKLYIYGEKNAFGAPGETISTHVEPSGTPPYTYQWYIKKPGESNFTKALATSDTYYMDITPERSGTQLYCVVTDAKGNVGTSDTVTMALFAIIQQPKNTCAPEGEELTLSCKAVGDGLKYQWYYYYDGARMEYKDGTGEVYTTTMYAFRNGYRVKCEITDAYGNKLTTDWATISSLSFLQQPENDIAASGKKVSASVSADGEGVKYQWYVKDPGSSKFTKSSVTSATYSYTMTPAKSGRQAYCVVTDQYGNSIRSNTVTFSMLSISKQPKSVTVAPKKTASVTVKATGQGLKYQWYVKDPGGSFTKSSIKKATYSFKMTSAKSGRQVYCVITDKWGNSIRTDTVTMKQESYAKITTQPKSVSGAAGAKVSTTVKASGDGLKYQWYVKDPGNSSFTKSSVKKATYSFALTSAKSGRQAYCVITDKYGNSVKSKTVTLTGTVTVTSEPKDQTTDQYEKVSTKVSATGYGLKYQWYLRKSSSGSFSKSSVKSATYSFTLSSSDEFRQVYCVITDKHGHSVKTRTVTLKYEEKQPDPTNPTDDEDSVLDKDDCMWCRGTGKCRDCDGTGYVYTYKPGIKGQVRERCGCAFGACRWCYGSGKA